MRTLLVGWMLLVVTLSVVAVAATNWYEYGLLNVERGVTPERGWERFIAVQAGDRAFVYMRRPRLHLP